MTIHTMLMKSQALQRPTSYMAITPDAAEAGPGPYPVLVQLHGYWDDYHAWLYKSNLALYVERLPVIVVLPNGENGYWVNWDPVRRYEDFITQDLWEHVNATFWVRREARWAIGGLSMGGYGAIRIGLKHPDKYCSIFAHSSFIPGPHEYIEWANSEEWWVTQFLRLNAEDDLDCYHWAEQVDRERLPRLSFDCGIADHLLNQNRRFHDYLAEQLHLPHEYAEHAGAHTWDYWDLHVRTALIQHAQELGIRPKPQPGTPEDDAEPEVPA
jgi:S-formylglutathione hydrolase FrmB